MRKWRAGSLTVGVIVALVAASLAGCSSSDDSDGTKVGMAYDIGGRGDRSFNDSAAAGLDRAKKDFDIKAQEVSPNKDGTDRRDRLNQLIESGFNPVIAVGVKYETDVAEAAAANPDKTFAIVDKEMAGDNIVSIVFNNAEGSYLMGMAAALTSKTKRVGFIGGVDDPVILEFEAGYKQGVAAVDPSIIVETSFLSARPDYSGFSNPAGARVAANGMYDSGVDVIFQAAGNSGPGVFQAAVEQRNNGNEVWAIGVDQDQYQTASDDEKKVILTSMIKRVDTGVYDFIERYVEDDNKKGGVMEFDLANEGIDYATSGGYVDAIEDQLEQAKEDIIDGKITVTTTTG